MGDAIGCRVVTCAVCKQRLNAAESHVCQQMKSAVAPRTRIHVGWRVVRERDGVREWWSSLMCGWVRRPIMPLVNLGDAQICAHEHGGRVVKVVLSYGRGR